MPLLNLSVKDVSGKLNGYHVYWPGYPTIGLIFESYYEDQIAVSDLNNANAAGFTILPQKFQDIFRIDSLDGMTGREIAGRHNIPERTIDPLPLFKTTC